MRGGVQEGLLSKTWLLGKQRPLPILLIELQHHVVRGDAERASALLVLLAFGVVHVRRGSGAVVGVVVSVGGAAVVPRQVKLDVWRRQREDGGMKHEKMGRLSKRGAWVQAAAEAEVS